MKAKYLFAYSIPLMAWISITGEGWISWLALIYAFGFLPGLELFLKGTEFNEDEEFLNGRYFDFIVYSMVPLQLFLMGTFLWEIKTGYLTLSWSSLAGKTIALALANGVLGINVAHELGHRKKPYEQVMALILLSTTLYMHFFIEHNKSHHKNVSTPLDHASAEKGITLYAFLCRSLYKSFLSSWGIDKKQTSLFIFIEVFLTASIGFVLGWAPMLAFLAAALGGMLLLEGVNYIEHYGLRRKLNPSGRYEKVGPQHSWNSNHPFSRTVLFELSRHSDHHANADRPYQLLRHFKEAPQLPTGYPGMLLLATIPFLWFKVMDPRTPANNPV